MTKRKAKQPVAVVCEKGGRCKGTHPLICETHGCSYAAGRAAAADSDSAADERGTRSQQRVGRRHLRWTAEYPRASGVWWWWNQDDRCKPDIVEVTAEPWMEAMKMGPTMKWPGLTRVRNVKLVGGLWAGPVEPPETLDEAVPPTD